MSRVSIKSFPSYFSTSALEKILLYGGEEEIPVYRVGKYGYNDRDAFLNYYDEVMQGLKQVRNKEVALEKYRNSVDSLSISCYEDRTDIEKYYMLTLKDTYPQKILLQGKTAKDCGLSCKTKMRDEKCTNSHVDWWLYQDAAPWTVFQEVEVK